MDTIPHILEKMATFDAETKSGAEYAQGNPHLVWKLLQDADRMIDDAFWNDYRNDVPAALYCRYLCEIYVGLAQHAKPD